MRSPVSAEAGRAASETPSAENSASENQVTENQASDNLASETPASDVPVLDAAADAATSATVGGPDDDETAATDVVDLSSIPSPSHGDRSESERLLQQLAGMAQDDPARAQVRDAVVTSHLPLVHHIARRFHGRGEPHDDVVQVGTIGLIKAVDRFEPGRGVPFAGYAVPTVTGEIRRYFRDRAGSVRLPRRVQEFQVAVTQARESLTHQLGRTPTVEEVAHLAGLDTDTVLEVLESAYSLSTVPLDVDNGVSDSLGEEDVALDEVLTRATLRPVLAKLAPRERRIIALRFVRGMSQAQIAEEVGLSQMHVSRLLSKTLARLRAEMTKPDPGA